MPTWSYRKAVFSSELCAIYSGHVQHFVEARGLGGSRLLAWVSLEETHLSFSPPVSCVLFWKKDMYGWMDYKGKTFLVLETAWSSICVSKEITVPQSSGKNLEASFLGSYFCNYFPWSKIQPTSVVFFYLKLLRNPPYNLLIFALLLANLIFPLRL